MSFRVTLKPKCQIRAMIRKGQNNIMPGSYPYQGFLYINSVKL